MPDSNGQPQNLVNAVSEVSERVSVLVRDEIALAKAEVTQKVTSLGKGAVAVIAGGVFWVFSLIFGLEALAWGLNDIFVNGAGALWIGFVIVFGAFFALGLLAFMFAWRKLRVGAPTPNMAIDEAKRIRATVSTKAGEPG